MIDNNKIQRHYKSLCIPRVNTDIKKDFIYDKINEFHLGKIINIKEIPLYNDTKYKRIIINMYWDKTDNKIKEIEEMLIQIGSIKLVYDMPWYWKLFNTI